MRLIFPDELAAKQPGRDPKPLFQRRADWTARRRMFAKPAVPHEFSKGSVLNNLRFGHGADRHKKNSGKLGFLNPLLRDFPQIAWCFDDEKLSAAKLK
jgi:hypothetical protein